MSNTTVSEAVARPARTGIQMAPAGLFTEVIDYFFYDLDERGYTIVFALLTLLIGWAQAGYENYRGEALWLRRVPPTDTPVEGA